MLLAVDIGNTNTVFGLFKDDALVKELRISTCSTRTDDEYAAFLFPLLANCDVIKGIAISCVSPGVLTAMQRFVSKYYGFEAVLVAPTNHCVTVAQKPALHLGSDLAVNAIAAGHIFDTACLIVDFGTATTFSLLEANSRNYLGIAIAPGMHSMLSSLRASTAQLPLLNFKEVETVLGTITVEAMLGGAYFGFVGMVEGIITRMKQEYQKDLKVVATGGLARSMLRATAKIDVIEPNLTLLGLKHFYSEMKSIGSSGK